MISYGMQLGYHIVVVRVTLAHRPYAWYSEQLQDVI
jgi:hypothetical protein